MTSNEPSPSFLDKLFSRKNKKKTQAQNDPDNSSFSYSTDQVTFSKANKTSSTYLSINLNQNNNNNDNNNNNNKNDNLIKKKKSNRTSIISTESLSADSWNSIANEQTEIRKTNINPINIISNSLNNNSNSDLLLSNTNLSPITEEGSLIKRFEINSVSNSSQLQSISKMLTNDNISENSNLNDVFHKLHVANYLTPTYCDYCSQLLFGLIKQGLKCEICGQNYHKRCIQNMPKICNKQLNLALKSSINKETLNFETNPNIHNAKQIEIEHTLFKKQIYNICRPILKCDFCEYKFPNDKCYLQCKDCQIIVHQKCAKHLKKNCKPSLNEDDQQLHMDDDAISNDFAMGINLDIQQDSDLNKMNLDENSFRDANIDDIDDIEDKETDQQISNDPEITQQLVSNDVNNLNENDKMDESSLTQIKHGQFRPGPRPNRKKTQIGLQRISQRVKKTNGFFWSGHMIYYTNENTDFITHYWKLDSQSINIYDSYRLEKKLKELPLASIRKAALCGLNVNSKDDCINNQKCLFTLTTEKEVFYCGMGNTDQNNTMNVIARNFYNMFKMVYLPYGNRQDSRISLKITAPKYEEKNLQDEYVINPQELLGSGQFGQVYGGLCKANNQKVAIKVIDKTRFKDFLAETSVFQNEITILYNVQHPGIVRLFALFDEVDHLYIVTEKMATDMLEMILNKQPARLTERVAKFIIYQILIALNKLHDRNIAHCDLKPENILLTENVEFPQVKICDFGYAKIIGENSFRRSMVGTPAYSPPELKQKRLYNNSIDMWSMGVIVYVSLSGTFPFEEDRDIYEQIMNPNFMFPRETWEHVSQDAIDLITHFLQVKIDRRMSVNKALQHRWFSEDYQLYYDLLDLEAKVKQKWLTTKEQEEKWNQPVHL